MYQTTFKFILFQITYILISSFCFSLLAAENLFYSSRCPLFCKYYLYIYIFFFLSFFHSKHKLDFVNDHQYVIWFLSHSSNTIIYVKKLLQRTNLIIHFNNPSHFPWIITYIFNICRYDNGVLSLRISFEQRIKICGKL